MLYVGLDCSIKDVAFVETTTGIAVHYATCLSLNSVPQYYLDRAYECSRILSLLDYTSYTILVDFTMYQMKARQAQMRLNSLFIGAILSYCKSSNVGLIEPKTVRKALGIKANASKAMVYQSFNEQYPEYGIYNYTISHIQDALVLSALGKEGKI